MLTPANPMIRSMVTEDKLALLSMTEAVGASRILDHLRAAVLPQGAFNVQKNLPDQDIKVVSGMVNVMVRKDINPAVLYVLLNATKEVHQGQTLVSGKGEFPTTVGTALPVHPLAAQWVKSGTPWLYSNFNPSFASLLDKYWLLVLTIFVISQIYHTLHYFYQLMEFSGVSLALRILRYLTKRVTLGRELGPVSRKLFHMAEKIVMHESQSKKAKALLEHVRPSIKLNQGR